MTLTLSDCMRHGLQTFDSLTTELLLRNSIVRSIVNNMGLHYGNLVSVR